MWAGSAAGPYSSERQAVSSDGAAEVASPQVLAREDLALAGDLFVIPDGDRFLLYAPSTMGVASVNAAAARRLNQVKQGRSTFDTFAAAFLAELTEAGILTSREEACRRASFPQKDEYDPDGITLFLTTRCTLACSYCYAGGSDRSSTMSWQTARAGLDWMFRHAAARGRDQVSVMFHGGGEVTIAWRLLQQCVDYARAEAAARGIGLTTSAGLNGVMTGPLLEWVIANIDNATISLDGLPEVHNAQRPLVNGKGSFDVIAAALRRMDEAGYQYGLRATVTRLGLSKLVESVEFMCRSFEARVVHLEPVFESGRACPDDLKPPDPHEFIREFRAAREIARAHGRELKYSGARFGTVTNKFCQTSDDLLALTPEGLVSACYEIGEPDDPRADAFLYGRLNGETRDLEIDMGRLALLRTLTVEHKSSCDGCFCRWSCAGECAAKLALEGSAWDASKSPRCIINRALTLDQMKEYLECGGGLSAPQPLTTGS